MVMYGDHKTDTASGTMVSPLNNTFEVMSVVQATSWLERHAPTAPAVIVTNSAHVVEGCSRWRHIWRGNGSKRGSANLRGRRRTIPDADLWRELDAVLERNPQIRIHLCKGRPGIARDGGCGGEVANRHLTGVRAGIYLQATRSFRKPQQ